MEEKPPYFPTDHSTKLLMEILVDKEAMMLKEIGTCTQEFR
jgi:hypothetical protein